MESFEINVTTGLTDKQRARRHAKRERIRKRNRIKATIIITLFTAIAVAVGAEAIIAHNTEWVEQTRVLEYVEEGDTLWNLCKDTCPDNMDIRDYIDLVKETNNIDSDIYVGDALWIPIVEREFK